MASEDNPYLLILSALILAIIMGKKISHILIILQGENHVERVLWDLRILSIS